ncbi:DAK2 domain-containing protein [Anaerococcus hydrogenalis]|uniref:DAK2 domain-containing protein n=1 Tax=Anaerococcus hydrogenalis TaxID=33029 RepID=UPI0029008A6A|nr:DAK2 domain-containing protein [Anaerococcus hydrogenalis]MDU1316601.1 DAK2 domain-containing protein [Anaerococcus hydrogenalis]
MKKIDSKKFKSIIIKSFELLNEKRDVVDSLNVFPVPDGDTGTNMTMTMKSGVEKVKQIESQSCYDIAKALSQGTLMGARGNSGVILSQLCRGMSKSLKGKDIIDGQSIKEIFATANKTAYKAVMKPTEGTILTVSRLMAEEAENSFENNIDIDKYLYKIIAAGHKALLDTPNLLPVLKEAKVVDSGGQGLMFLLEGALKAINGEISIETDLSEIEIEDLPSKEFNVDLSISIDEDDKDNLIKKIEDVSTSLTNDFDNGILNLSFDCDSIKNLIEIVSDFGQILSMDVENTDPEVINNVKLNKKPSKKYGFIAVSRGEGYDKVFESLNIDRIISGGQTMNPSTEDIYKAIEKVDSENIIIFPNNKNIIMSAKQACELSDKTCRVVETRSIPESFSALLSFDEDESLEDNMENFNDAIEDVRVLEVTIAVRDTNVNNVAIKKDEYIGIVDNNIVTSKSSIEKTAKETLLKAVDDDTSLITIYYGEDISDREAKKLQKFAQKKFKDSDVELIYGGQPLYYYTITLE